MISPSFPTLGCCDIENHRTIGEVGEIEVTEMNPSDEEFDLTPCSPDENGVCTCPRREPTPPPPEFKQGQTAAQLRELLIKHYAASAFNRCTRQKLPMMKGDPLPIPTKVGAKPTVINNHVPVPRHWEDQVERDLKRDVALGVIEPVPLNTPVTWCARMIVVPKHSGEPRRTVDLQGLNRSSVRQTHPLQSPFKLASDVPAGKVKSVLDVWNSFHSVPVREEDRHKLTFVTQWGRFRYKVAPQGYLASGDGYTHRFANITEGIENKRSIVDDTLIWSDNIQQNFEDVCKLLEVCHTAGLIFNSDKLQFGQDTVEFAGLEVTMSGVRPSRKFLESIRAFPAPKTLSEARSFFGMVNQVNYAFAMSTFMSGFRHLLRPDTWEAFEWNDTLKEEFEAAKEMIIEAVKDGVSCFELSRPTCLATDWSKQGLGFFLMQKWCECKILRPDCCTGGWKLVLAGGRFTSPAESRYSPVEGECLAVSDALFKARHFVLGCPNLIIAVDHKPLLGLLNDKSLADIDNPRLLMLKEKTLWFSFDVIHIPGKLHCGPDYMSRQGQYDVKCQREVKKEARINLIKGFAMSAEDERTDSIDSGLVASVAAAISHDGGLKAVTFSRIRKETESDTQMQQLIQAIQDCPAEENFPLSVAKYNRYREALSVLDGVPMYGRRVIVPAGLRSEVLQCLHSGHQGTSKMNERALQAVFWPGITTDIETIRQGCDRCDTNAPSQAALPPLPLASPDYPFQMLVADYCDIKGKSWLVVADRFSGWVSVFYYPREATATDLIRKMKEVFCTMGVAEHFSSDAGPQFKSEHFKKFLSDWGVEEHRVSSAYFPHSNLRAETAVKTAKRLIRDNTASDGTPNWDKVFRALMNHRNTPDAEWKLSPAQILFGRPIRDFLPIKLNQYSPQECWITDRDSRELAMKHRVHLGMERWSAQTKGLSALKVGQHVTIQNQHGAGKIAKRWDRTGVVIEDLGYNKYRVRIDGSGRVTDRNRQFLRLFKPATFTYSPGITQTTHEGDSHPVVGDGHEDRPVAIPKVSPEVSNTPVAPLPDTTATLDVQTPHVEYSPAPVADPTLESELHQPEQTVPTPAVSTDQAPVTYSPVRRSGRVRKPNQLYGSDVYDLSRH